MLLGVLSTSVLLGGVGLISLRVNLQVKSQVSQIVLEEESTTTTLIKIEELLRKSESKIYQFISLKKSGLETKDIEQNKQEILELSNQLDIELNRLDKLAEERLTKNLEYPLTTKKEDIQDEVSRIRITDKLKERGTRIKTLLQTILESDDIEKDQEFLATQLEPLLNEDISPALEKYQENFFSDLRKKQTVIINYLDNNSRTIEFSTAASLIFSLFLGIYISYRISRKIKQLQAAAILVGEAEFNVYIPENESDEIGILAKTFNKMSSNLKNTTISKAYLDNILASMVDSLIVTDTQGTIKKVNISTLKLLGYQETELIDQNIQLILADSSLNILDLIQTSHFSNYDVTYVTKKGKTIPVAFSSSVIQDRDGKAQGIVCVGRDVTEKQQAQKALRESEERYALASLAANDGLWDWNLLSNHIYFSPRWKSLLGYEDEDITNSPDEWFKRIHPDYVEQVSQEIISNLQNSISHFEITYPMLHQDGSYRWMLCRGIPVKNDEGKIYRLTGSQTDVTQSRQAEAQLEHQALYDGLTGLPNRRFFQEKLQELFEQILLGQDNIFAVLFIDLDRFKKVNDSLGHLVGDELLIDFTRRLRLCLRSGDTLARLGGDEFAILVENIEDLNDVTQLAEIILSQLEKPFELQGLELFVSASIGIAPSTKGYENIEELLRDADTAMHQAKAKGKACYVVFEPDMHLEVVNTLELENDLRRAIEREEFDIFYQPIVKLSKRQIVGFEALVRWQHPSKGRISPGQFIPIAEETGLIVPIGEWVMEKAIRQMGMWQDKYEVAQNLTISVNISPVQLKHWESNDFSVYLEKIEKIFQETNLKPSHLKLEITESTIMESLDRANSILQQIKNLGIKLSMDDFGTGYSSLNSLHQLPIDILKIDRSFVKNLSGNSDKVSLIRTIVNLAQNLRMDVIAEGVETKEEQAILTELNCEYGQGYLFSKPISSNDVEILIGTMEQFTKYSVDPILGILPVAKSF